MSLAIKYIGSLKAEKRKKDDGREGGRERKGRWGEEERKKKEKKEKERKRKILTGCFPGSSILYFPLRMLEREMLICANSSPSSGSLKGRRSPKVGFQILLNEK